MIDPKLRFYAVRVDRDRFLRNLVFRDPAFFQRYDRASIVLKSSRPAPRFHTSKHGTLPMRKPNRPATDQQKNRERSNRNRHQQKRNSDQAFTSDRIVVLRFAFRKFLLVIRRPKRS